MRRRAFIWVVLTAVLAIPIGVAAQSPLLAWRSPIYIAAGFAGILACVLLVVQPLLAGGFLNNMAPLARRHWHQWTGTVIAILVLVHIGGLWITSPPDVIDALTFSSPTPFSIWGVVAMWALVATILVAVFRRALRFRPKNWRNIHSILVTIVATTTVIHALLIEGAMGMLSKYMLCAAVLLALGGTLWSIKRGKRR